VPIRTDADVGDETVGTYRGLPSSTATEVQISFLPLRTEWQIWAGYQPLREEATCALLEVLRDAQDSSVTLLVTGFGR
jgi:hypothetical protein